MSSWHRPMHGAGTIEFAEFLRMFRAKLLDLDQARWNLMGVSPNNL